MLATGTQLRGYRIDGTLGEGGMGVVYLATQLSLNRQVALKILSPALGNDPQFSERFRREGLLQAAIDHPNIVTVYEAGETEHGLFLAMRVVRGPTLKDLIVRGELDIPRTLKILDPVADALETAHASGLIHRDIKPQNILVGARDHAFLADFGLTKSADEVGGLTAEGQFVGTIDYVSPEQIRGDDATGSSDTYALAGVLYECLTGQVPFQRSSEAAVLYAHLGEPPPKVTDKRPDLPPAIDAVVERAMAKDPAQRPATPSAFMAEVAEALGERSASTGTAPAVGAPGPSNGGGTAPADRIVPAGDLTVPRGSRRAPEVTRAAGAAAPPAPISPPAPVSPPVRDDTVTAAPERKRVGAPLIAAGVAAVVALAVIGYLVGSSGGADGPAEADFPNSASVGVVDLNFPAGWRRAGSNPGIPGFELDNPLVLGGPGGGTLAAGTTDATGPTLLPEAFLRELGGGEPPRGEPVSLGDVQALRYRDLRAGDGPPFTVYAVPTSRGVATLACRPGATRAEAFLAGCEAVATTLTLAGAEGFELGPDARYARSLDEIVKRLQRERDANLQRLRSARTRAAQAAAATELADVYSTATRAIGKLQVSPEDAGANDDIERALDAVARAWRVVGSAARSGDADRYRRGTRAVRRGQRQVDEALGALKALGYEPA